MRRSSRRDFVKALGLGATALLAPRWAWGQATPPRRPNVIFFLMDDMGWMDSTVYGSRYYDTPNMERLAKRSMMFTDAYAANPLCSPTRASILTGKYPARLGITAPLGHLPPLPPDTLLMPRVGSRFQKMLFPESKRFLPPEEYTIAEALRDAGYKTAHIGKWHLGLNPEHWPETQGFEVSFHGAPDPGPRSYFSPYQFQAGTVTDGPRGEYITDRVTDEALKFIEANRDRPFLLHLWHYAVHGPWGHKEEITKRFLDRKDPRGKQDNPLMASMLWSADESLGRVLDKLEELKIADNTILIFFSDNGGNVHSNTEEDGKEPPKDTPQWKMLQDYRRWAGYRPPTNNFPLRSGKGTIFEGGTREPMFVCWPGVVAAGSRCSEVVSSVDFYPTILEMVGLQPKQGQILDGESIVPLLKQAGKLGREAIFCHFPHSLGSRSPAATYVRKGDWKLIRVHDVSEFFPDRHMLYNLREDIAETNNLATQMPDKVKELDALIDKFLADTGALVPVPNPAYDPRTKPIQGWRPLGECALSAGKDGLVIETQAKTDRVSMFTNDTPDATGALVMKFRMRTESGKNGFAYWSTLREPKFARERRVDFRTTPDGQWREYEARFTAKDTLTGLRLDASATPGRVEIEWVRLCKEDGAVLKAWQFSDPPAAQ